MNNETTEERTTRILDQLRTKYPGKKAYDMYGNGMHFVCETEPVDDHPEYDRAIEVIIQSKPHKHNKMVQEYTILSGNLELHVGDKTVNLKPGDRYTVESGNTHWATSNNECWVEIFSKPSWTKEDHIPVKI